MEISYKIFDILEKNISECFDIVIFNPIFLTVNIQNIQMYLFDEENKESNILNGLDYEIIVAKMSIYHGLISSTENKLFISENIPFSYIIFHKCLFVIYNLSNETVKKISNYTITFKYILNTNLPIYLMGQIPTNAYEIKWNCGIYETNHENNFLRFMGGMCGMCFRTGNESEWFPDDYLKNNKKIFYYDNNFEINKYIILNISHIDDSNNWVNNYNSICNNYSINKILHTLITETIPNDLKNSYHVISETFKIPVWNNKFIKYDNAINDQDNNIIYDKQIYIYKLNINDNSDAISNVKFICDSNKYIFLNVSLSSRNVSKIGETHNGINLYGDIEFGEKYELEFVSSKYGYEISGLGNFMVIPTIRSFQTTIEIKFYILDNKLNNKTDNILADKKLLFDTPIDFWIKYDRYCMDSSSRKKMNEDFFNWEEFPIVDIIEYLPEYKCQDSPINNLNEYKMVPYDSMLPQDQNNSVISINLDYFNHNKNNQYLFDDLLPDMIGHTGDVGQLEPMGDVGPTGAIEYIIDIEQLEPIYNIGQLEPMGDIGPTGAIEYMIDIEQLEPTETMELVNTVGEIGTIGKVGTIGEIGTIEKVGTIGQICFTDLVDEINKIDKIDKIYITDEIDKIYEINKIDKIDKIDIIEIIDKIGTIDKIDEITNSNEKINKYEKLFKSIKKYNIFGETIIYLIMIFVIVIMNYLM